MIDFNNVTVTSIMRKTPGGSATIHLNEDEFECLKFLVEDSVKFHKQMLQDIQDDDLLKEIGATNTKSILQQNNSLFEKLKSIGFDVEKFE